MTTDKLKELALAATEGPWKHIPWHIEEGPPAVRCDGGNGHIVATTASEKDAAFIAAARNGVLNLIRERDEALERERQTFKDAAEINTRAEAALAVMEREGEALSGHGDYTPVTIRSGTVASPRPEAVEEAVKAGDWRAVDDAIWFFLGHENHKPEEAARLRRMSGVVLGLATEGSKG